MSRGKRKAGAKAGHTEREGYVLIQIDRVVYRAHNLAFLFMMGRWPYPECDHRDVDPGDNRWSNLRESTRAQNSANRKKSKANISGFTGVRQRGSGWAAQTNAGGKFKHLGTFRSPEEAHEAYKTFVVKFFGEYARAE